MKRPKRQFTGFTLIEIILAIAVLGVGLAYIASMQATVHRIGGENHFRIAAEHFAARKAQELQAAPFDALRDRVGVYPENGPAPVPEDSMPVMSEGMFAAWHAELSPAASAEGVIEIRVSVEWGTDSGGSHAVTQTAYAVEPAAEGAAP